MIIYTKIPQWYALHLYKKWYRAKKFDVLKPQTCVPRNFLGIFRGNSEEQYKLIEIPKKYDFLRISSVYSEEIWFPRYFLGIFRGNMISSVFHRYIPEKFRGTPNFGVPWNFLGNSSEYSEDLIFRQNVRLNYAVFL